MKNIVIALITVVLPTLSALTGLAAAAEPPPRIAELDVSPGAVVFQPRVGLEELISLRVTGPDGFVSEQTTRRGAPVFELPAGAADGVYRWELRVRAESQSGGFQVDGGVIVYDELAVEETATVSDRRGSLGSVTLANKDQVILDDLIVDGSACIGLDCVNGEVFDFDTLRLKENNLRIKFEDTSSSASFPTNDWQLTANEAANGGLNKFSIDDVDAGQTPFTIEAGAPSDTIYAVSAGQVGIGTALPCEKLHVMGAIAVDDPVGPKAWIFEENAVGDLEISVKVAGVKQVVLTLTMDGDLTVTGTVSDAGPGGGGPPNCPPNNPTCLRGAPPTLHGLHAQLVDRQAEVDELRERLASLEALVAGLTSR